MRNPPLRLRDLVSLLRADNEIAARCFGVALGVDFVTAACFLGARI
jgi:hypothetical protein